MLIYTFNLKSFLMKKLLFVRICILAGTISILVPIVSFVANEPGGQKKSNQELYELRVYTLKNEVQQKMVENYFQKAAIPAYNRYGIKKIGVFSELKPSGQTKIYVIIPFQSFKDFLNIQDKLSKDKSYNEAGSEYLNAPASEPAYQRMESSMLLAFEQMPAIEVPAKKSGLYELRRYESAGEQAAKKKIEMFNTAGEIDIFKRVGLRPVFFGQTIIGTSQPNLTYLLSFDDMVAHDRLWKLFGSDPEWKKISSIPEYADSKIVSHITSTFLVPATFSQF